MEEMMNNLIEQYKGCEHESNEFYFHSECHPSSPTWLRWKNGIYDLICAECEKIIIRNVIPQTSNN